MTHGNYFNSMEKNTPYFSVNSVESTVSFRGKGAVVPIEI